MLKAVLCVGCFVVFCAHSLSGAVGSGTIKGIILDRDTREPLVGVNVLIVDSKFGATTGADGGFAISGVPAGIRTLEVRLVGYQTVKVTDVAVSPDRTTVVNAALRQTSIDAEAVTATAGFFSATEVATLGAIGFDAQEIRRSPGSANDVSRILMALPSVAAVADNSNDLAVRGGSPMENAFYVDGIPVPNINHFPSEGSTGGPIGILNIDFIDNVDFLASGFPSKYGDRLSSVVDIRLREPAAGQTNGKAFLSFAGVGAEAEGGLADSLGTWMISGSKSYLDLLVGAIGTGTAPQYGDLQGKAVFNLGRRHRIEILDIFGDDKISFSRDNAIDRGQRAYGTYKAYQNTVGINWRALWSSTMTSTTTASLSTTGYHSNAWKVNSDAVVRTAENTEESIVLRNVNCMSMGTTTQVEFGAEARYDAGVYDYFRLGDTTNIGTVNSDSRVHRTLPSPKFGFFLNVSADPFARLTASGGVRGDYYRLNRRWTLSPRIALAYRATDVLTLKANGGVFYQQVPLIVLSGNDRYSGLDDIVSRHIGVGLEYMLDQDTRLTIDAYDKEYDALPIDMTNPTSSVVDDALFTQEFQSYSDLLSRGSAQTRGLEMVLQKKMARDIYGLVSASYFRSKYKDGLGVWRNRIYDNQYIFSAIGGYKPNDTWEFSVRWTYAGGRPYTPFDPVRSSQADLGIIDQSRVQGERMPAYHALNLRADRKFFFDRSSLDIYVSIWNAYNRSNVAEYFWNATTNALDAEYQWGILPVGGVEYEF